MGVAGFTQQFLEMATSTHCSLKRRFMSPKKKSLSMAATIKTGFEEAVGSSGTIKTIQQAIAGFWGWDEITLAG